MTFSIFVDYTPNGRSEAKFDEPLTLDAATEEQALIEATAKADLLAAEYGSAITVRLLGGDGGKPIATIIR